MKRLAQIAAAILITVSFSVAADSVPSSDQIAQIQERHTWQRQPDSDCTKPRRIVANEPSKASGPPQRMSRRERAELKAAVELFVREYPGELVHLQTR